MNVLAFVIDWEQVKLWASIAVSACSVLGFALSLIAKGRNAKLAKVASAALTIVNEAKSVVEEAEKFVNYSGAEKKQYAITRIKEYCIENNIAYTEQEISDDIEKMVEVSKQVNARNTISKTAK